MKKIYLVIFAGLITLSCEEDFSPYGEFKEKYIFNCILRGDSTFQIAALTKSYDPADFNPELITDDIAIKGADIRILIGDSVYIFKDSSTARIDTSAYKTPFRFYYNNYLSLPPNKVIEAEILLPSGRRIHSMSKTPPKIQFDQRSSDVISAQSPNVFQFYWNISFSGQYFAPRMVFTYTKNVNGITQLMVKDVPYTYISEENAETPVFPPVGVQSTLSVEKEAITKALNEISEGDPNKQNYTIYEYATVEVLSFDQHLSKYYSTTNGSLDDLTVRIDEKDYTNIENGYGIFASYIKEDYKIRFLPSYIQSFGYKILIPD
jgi:hypothetical protein